MKPSDLIRLALHLRSILDAFDRYVASHNGGEQQELSTLVEHEGAEAMDLIMAMADAEAVVEGE